MERITYLLSAFTASGGNIFTDSLDSAVAAQGSLGPVYLFSIFNEGFEPSLSIVEFYFNAALNATQIADLNSVVSTYAGLPGYDGQEGSYLVANLPIRACNPGDRLWATNGRKVGEGPAAGTGVPVYWSGSSWLVFSSDSAVLT